jgi:hypothetical protein
MTSNFKRHITMIRTAFKLAFALTGFMLVSSSVLHAEPIGSLSAKGKASSGPTVTTYATGLTNPRGLAFGPDGLLYVAEAGVGGDEEPADDCDVQVNMFSPFTAGYSGRVTRVLADGTTETVADNLPSIADGGGTTFGPTDVAFIDGTLYVLIEMGGCTHAMPEDLPAILRVNPDGSTTNVANLNAWHAATPPNFIKDLDKDPAETDHEPGGVFHSMIAFGRYLYVVETNRGFLLRVDPANGVVETLYDMSIDNAEHNPIVMTRRGNEFYVGTFGEDDGDAELAVFDKNFTGYSLPFESLNPIVGLAWHGNQLYGVELFSNEAPWASGGNLVAFDHKTGARRELLSGFEFAIFPNGLVAGPDGALYMSNQGISFTNDGDGSVLRIVP